MNGNATSTVNIHAPVWGQNFKKYVLSYIGGLGLQKPDNNSQIAISSHIIIKWKGKE